MTRVWRRFLAVFRLSMNAVCEESVGRDPHNDFHDYPDSVEGSPMHFYTYRCKRCGKEFCI